MNTKLVKIVFYLLLLLIWEGASRIFENKMFPSFSSILVTLYNFISEGTLLKSLTVSIKRVVIGFVISIIAGIVSGFLINKSRFFEDTLSPALFFFQTLPSLALFPLAVMIFGKNEMVILFIIVVGSTASIALSVDNGIKGIPPILLDITKTFGAGELQTFINVTLKGSIPTIIAGIRIAWAFAWRSLIGSELLLSNGGLGELLQISSKSNSFKQVLATIFVIAGIGILIDGQFLKRVEIGIRRKWGYSM